MDGKEKKKEEPSKPPAASTGTSSLPPSLARLKTLDTMEKQVEVSSLSSLDSF